MRNKILTKTQISLLKALGEDGFIGRKFYLTGGTALAGFYLHHRYSEDLDFFSEDEFDISQINVALKKLREKLGISKIDFQQSYNRNLFFLHFGSKVVKTEFTYFPFPRLERGKKEYGIQIDSLIDIAANKLFSVYQRTQARDYIDLYVILRKGADTIQELIKKAKIKFDWHIDPLQLGTQFVKVKKAKDYPRMILKVRPAEIEGFFFEEAKKLKNDIIK